MNGTTFSALFGGFTRRKMRLQHAHFLYGAVVASARNPDLFRSFDMPDTFDGRFEMLAAHLYVLNARLRQDGDNGRALSQEVIDLFLADMDVALRESAVGDQVVPKRLAKMTRVVHGRAAAYDRARDAEGDTQTEIAVVIARNVFNGRKLQQNELAMADWMLQQIASLEKHPLDQILADSSVFCTIPASETETV